MTLRAHLQKDMQFLQDRDARDYVVILDTVIRDHITGPRHFPGI